MNLRRLLAAAALAAACGGPTDPGTPPPDDPSCTMAEAAVANEGWSHVTEGQAVVYRHNPPASGPHYPVWLRYQAYTSAIARPYWVHNLEHGAIVLLHRPDAPAAGVTTLNDVLRTLPVDGECGHARALLVPDPALDQPFAAVAANFALTGACVSPSAIRTFTTAHRNRAPENICADGSRP